MVRQRPLDDPQWSGPVINRLVLIGITVAAFSYLVATTVAIVAARWTALDWRVQLVGALAAVGASALTALVAVRRRIRPMYEVLDWSNEASRDQWIALGLGETRPDPEAALAALAGRDDADSGEPGGLTRPGSPWSRRRLTVREPRYPS